jgi:hypothetical protein
MLPACEVSGWDMSHSPLLHEVMDKDKVIVVHASLGEGSKTVMDELHRRQRVVVENGDRCALLTILYDRGASISVK